MFDAKLIAGLTMASQVLNLLEVALYPCRLSFVVVLLGQMLRCRCPVWDIFQLYKCSLQLDNHMPTKDNIK